jgi:hypothetical protein
VVVDLSRLSSMDWWVALILIWAGRVISRRGVLMPAAAQPAVAQRLTVAGASKTAVMCASVRQARRRPGAPAASA